MTKEVDKVPHKHDSKQPLLVNQKKWINTGITLNDESDEVLFLCDKCNDGFFISPPEVPYYNFCPRCGQQ